MRFSPGAGAFHLLLSIVLVGVGLWIRLRILETPVFRNLVAEQKIERTPILEVCRKQSGHDHPHRAGAHFGAGAILHLHRLYLRLRRYDAPCIA